MPVVESNPNITFRIAYESEDVVVVEKPARRVSLPGKGHTNDTLLNGLFARWGNLLQNLGQARDFGMLHRLDRETSGLIVVALRAPAYDALREAFTTREVRKFYWAVCAKAPEELSGVIKLGIVETPGGGERDQRRKTAFVGKHGKPAATAYRVLDRSDLAALIEARPITGRLHQVRVHLDAIGSPILGDEVYGPRRTDSASPRLALQAHRIAFTHPTTGEEVDVRTKWPSDLRRLLRTMRLRRPDIGPDAGKAYSPDADDEDAKG